MRRTGSAASRRRRRELEVEKRLVRRLEADKQAAEERIRALEARAGVGQKRIRELEAGAADDEWTRMCDDKTVWPVLYKAVALRFHPDRTGGDAELQAFFKVAANKNDAFNGKGPESAADKIEREEVY